MADVSTIKTAADAKVTRLTPMALAANVQRSVNFYQLLGMELRGQLKTTAAIYSGGTSPASGRS